MNDSTTTARQALIAAEHTGEFTADERADLALLTDLLAQGSTWAEPSSDLEDEIVRAVAMSDHPTSMTPASIRTARPRHHRRRFPLVAAAATAAAAVAVTLATLLGASGGPGADYAARLGATDLAPGAHATAAVVRTDAGFRVSLDARGLPRLPDGQFYEAWLKNAAGTLVPIGTFSSSDGRVTLWSGVSPREFSSIAVTIEASDNDQASSGRRVLIGTIRSR